MNIDTETRVAIEHLVSELLYRLDHGMADTIWELYTEDCVMSGPLGDMVGRESIKTWGEKRAQLKDVVGRHFIGGIRLAWEGEELHGTIAYQTFRDSSENPVLPASVGEFREQYRKVDGTWLIHRREVVPIFGGENAAAHAARLAAQGATNQ